MASLSNINGLFDVHSTGAILFSTSHGTSGQILRSNGNAAPTWVAASTVIGGPYLPLTGGTLTGATATATGISFTVGGALSGTSATFTGIITATGGTSTEWNTSYDNSITALAVTGTTTKTLTATQQDGGTLTASWTDDNTGTVTSSATTSYIPYMSTATNVANSQLLYDTTNSRTILTATVGPNDDIRGSFLVRDDTAMAANVGGQIALGYKYYTSGGYTEGALIRTYKENAVDGEYGSGLKIQVRNHGASLGTKLTLNPSGHLTVSGNVTGAIIVGTGGTSTEWNTSYDNSITGLAVTGTTTKTLTATQQDGGTLTASWTDNDSNTSWPNVGAGIRTNYDLGIKPPVNSYAGFYFQTETGGNAGYFLIRGGGASGAYTDQGISLIADAGWLSLVSRTTTDKGVRIMAGATSTTRLIVTSAGNVGIGTAFTPGAQLHNYSTATTNVFITGYGTAAQNDWGAQNAMFVKTDNGLLISKQNANNNTNRLFNFYNDSNGYAQLYMYTGGNTPQVQIKTSGYSYFNGGNIGIGVTGPLSKLQIIANQSAADPGSKNYTGSAINTDGGDIATGRVFFQGSSSGATDLCGINNETSRIVLYNYTDTRYLQYWDHAGSSFIPNGNLGVGTTVNGALSEKLFVDGAVRQQSAVGLNTNGSIRTGLGAYDNTAGWGAGIGGQLALGYIYTGTTGYTEGALIKMYKENSTQSHYGSGLRWSVRQNGTNLTAKMQLSPSGTLTVIEDIVAYGSPSDKKLKENIKPISLALDKVTKLQGVTFDWKKSDSMLNIKEDIGFIAQDVQKVVPELVRKNSNGLLSMRHQGVVPMLVEAIKELEARVKELENK